MICLTMQDGSQWIEKYGINDLDLSILDVENAANKLIFRQFFDDLKKKNDLLLLSLLCAYVKQYFSIEYFKAGLDLIEISYERLVQYPEKEIRKIIRFIGLDWSNELLNHHSHKDNECWGGSDGRRKIDTNSIDKWRKHFTEKDIKKIDSFINRLNESIIA